MPHFRGGKVEMKTTRFLAPLPIRDRPNQVGAIDAGGGSQADRVSLALQAVIMAQAWVE